jgi:hypothetical protein
LLSRFGLYDFFANIIPGIFFLWSLGSLLDFRYLKEALPLAGGLAETSVLVVVGYLTGLLLQGVSQLLTERILLWGWGGFPSDRWLLPEDDRLSAEYKTDLAAAIKRRFDLTLESVASGDPKEKRLRRTHEVFYRCYRSVEKASDLPQTFNVQYGLFRGLLTTFALLAFISLTVVARQLWLSRTFAWSPHLFFAIAATLGAVITYYRAKKRGEDFARAVLDVFIVNNPPPAGIGP